MRNSGCADGMWVGSSYGSWMHSRIDHEFFLRPLTDGVHRRTENGVVSSWCGDGCRLEDDATHFGYVFADSAVLLWGDREIEIPDGFFFSVPGRAELRGGSGFVVTHNGYTGMFSMGGPIEETGRLRYIDGCSDSLLIGPLLKGDPCFNFLCFPPGIEQTAHTHPSERIGLIVSGSGLCRTPSGDRSLTAGTIFVLPPDAEHAFHTKGEAMRIVVYHPDSDVGPTHDDHPMLNRTIVDGVSARDLPSIRTR